MADDKFDAIVVGAGPAGSACAYVLAKEGKNVLLVERGDSAGGKNVSGGRLYTYALEMIEPGMYQRAPLQRKIVREQIMLLGRTGRDDHRLLRSGSCRKGPAVVFGCARKAGRVVRG